MDKPTDRTVYQNAWVVDDLDAAMNKWVNELGVGPFFVTEYGDQFASLTYRGKPAEISMRIGVSQAGPLQIELIQPTSNDPSAYRDAYPPGTEGFHHMCVYSHDMAADTEYFERLGYPAVTAGEVGPIKFAYFDTRPLMGCMWEVVEKAPGSDERRERLQTICANWDGINPIRRGDEM